MTAEGEQQPDAADVANAAAEAVATEGDDRPSDADIIAHAASFEMNRRSVLSWEVANR